MTYDLEHGPVLLSLEVEELAWNIHKLKTAGAIWVLNYTEVTTELLLATLYTWESTHMNTQTDRQTDRQTDTHTHTPC